MRIAITSTDISGLGSLYDWLALDDDVARDADVRMRASGDRPGSQSPLDYIDVVLSNATAIAGLVLAYRSWRRSAPSASSTPSAKEEITFKVGEVEVTARDADDETIERIITALTEAQAGEDDTPPEAIG